MSFKNTLIYWFRNLKYYVKHYPQSILFIVFSSLIMGFFPIAVAYCGKKVIELITNPTDFTKVIFVIAFIISFKISLEIINLINKYLTIKFANYINLKIRQEVLFKIRKIRLEKFYEPDFLNSLYRSSAFNAQSIQSSLSVLLNIIEIFIYLIFSIIILSNYSYIYALIIIVLSFSSNILTVFIKTKRIKHDEKNTNLMREKAYYENIFKDKTILSDSRTNNYTNYLKEKYFSCLDAITSKEKKFYKNTFPLIFLNYFLAVLLKIMSYSLIILLVIYLNYDVSLYYFLISIVLKISSNIKNITTEYTKQMSNSISSFYFNELFCKTNNYLEKEPTTLKKFDIEFQNVKFKYPGTDKFVLNKISFTLKDKNSLGIVGENGSGKTTILKLLLGLYEDFEGKILIGGKNIKELKKEDLASNFSVIFQDFNQYALSYYENVFLGNLSSEMDLEKIDCLFKEIGLDERVQKSYAKGNSELTKILSKKSEELSIGQWQKLALIRALYRNSQIFVLDEPVRNLDASVEKNIFDVINNLKKTRIVVSHRLADMIYMDNIIIIKNGIIIGAGNHAKLIKENEYYQEMFNAQAKKFK